jgi:protein-L-isoaspartate(D-aspartate) O-methyltransferase
MVLSRSAADWPEWGGEMADFALQRKNMVESQVRTSDVTDRRVIRAMLEIPREAFVPEARRALAYMEGPVPVSLAPRASRALMSPRVLAKLIQALELDENAQVLDVGAATGYAAAVMARIAARVVAIESDGGLAEHARTALAAIGFENAEVEVIGVGPGSLASGWAMEAPYDAILIDGAVPAVPDTLLDQLKDGGRLVAVVQSSGLGRAAQWHRHGGTFDSRVMFDAAAPPLPGFERAPQFDF